MKYFTKKKNDSHVFKESFFDLYLVLLTFDTKQVHK
jgi:hypothetical protein